LQFDHLAQISELSSTQAAYFAGIIDGEGCVSIRKAECNRFEKSPRYSARITVGNTSRDLIEQLFLTFGGAVTYRFGTTKKRPCWLWSLQSRKAREVIRAVRPYLVVKQHQADLLAEFVDNFESFKGARPGHFGGQRTSETELSRREALFVRMKTLNRVGALVGQESVPGNRRSRGVTAEFARAVRPSLLDPDDLDLVPDLDADHDVHP
jgi:hypothetical protein